MPFAFHYAARSDVGMVRSNNEDSGYAGPHLLAMADGMGGHAGGDVASSTVIGALVRLDGEALGGRDVSHALLERIHRANAEIGDQVHADPSLDGMGTTLIAMLRAGDKIVLAHIGDSRAFMVRDGVVTQITKDHSFVQNLVDEGRITADEAQTHPQRSLVTRVLTGADDDEPDLVVRQGRIGDRYVISSDGLTDYVARDTIDEVLTTTADPGETADRLVALALRAGAPDNVTVVVGDLVDIASRPPTQPQVVGAAAARADRHPADPDHPGRQGRGAHRAGHRRAPTPTTASPWPRRGRARGAAPCCAWPPSLVVLVVVVAGSSYAVYAWSQRQYYLAEQDGVVAVFRGVEQNLGPISLSSPEYATTIAIDDLPTSYQDSLQAGHRGRRPRRGRRAGRRAAAAGARPAGGPSSTARCAAPCRRPGPSDPHPSPTAEPTSARHAGAPRASRRPCAHRPPGPALATELTGDLMSIVSSFTPRKGRNVELALVVGAVAIVLLAYLNVELAATGTIPPGTLTLVGGYLALAIGFHLVLRWRASYADPLMLPIITLLNGLGLVMIHRIDIAHGKSIADGVALRQLMWTAVAMVVAAIVLLVLRDHRVLRRYTYLAGAIGFGLLLLPLFPVIGTSIYGSRIWIQLGPFSFQPGEIAKIALAIFFAGYLVQTRDALSVAGRKVLGLTLPAGPRPRPDPRRLAGQPGRARLRARPRLLAAVLRAVRRDALRRHRAGVVDRHRPDPVLRRCLPRLPRLRPRADPGAALARHLQPRGAAGVEPEQHPGLYVPEDQVGQVGTGTEQGEADDDPRHPLGGDVEHRDEQPRRTAARSRGRARRPARPGSPARRRGWGPGRGRAAG